MVCDLSQFLLIIRLCLTIHVVWLLLFYYEVKIMAGIVPIHLTRKMFEIQAREGLAKTRSWTKSKTKTKETPADYPPLSGSALVSDERRATEHVQTYLYGRIAYLRSFFFFFAKGLSELNTRAAVVIPTNFVVCCGRANLASWSGQAFSGS